MNRRKVSFDNDGCDDDQWNVWMNDGTEFRGRVTWLYPPDGNTLLFEGHNLNELEQVVQFMKSKIEATK